MIQSTRDNRPLYRFKLHLKKQKEVVFFLEISEFDNYNLKVRALAFIYKRVIICQQWDEVSWNFV